jgi:WD40 repeat protein
MAQSAQPLLDAPSLGELASALRGDAQRADQAPQDIAALLYAGLRRQGYEDEPIGEFLHLGPDDLPLRITSITPPTSEFPRLRPPGPVAAIHTHEETGTMIVRCSSALLFVNPASPGTVVRTPRLTASTLSANGNAVVTGDAEGTVAFWSVFGGQITQRFAVHRAAVTHVLITADFAWSCAADGSIVRYVDGTEERYEAPAGISAAYAVEQSLVVGCRNGDIFHVQSDGRTYRHHVHDGPVTGVAFRKGWSGVVSVGADRTLRISDESTKIDTGHTLGITGLVWGADDLFATFSADRTVRLWDLRLWQDPREVAVLARHEAAVTAACFGRIGDTEVLVTGSADGVVMLWDREGNFVASHRRHQGAVRACAFRHDEILTGGDDRRLDRCDAALVVTDETGVTEIASVENAIGICNTGLFDLEHEGGSAGVALPAVTSAVLRADGSRALIWKEGSKIVSEVDISGKNTQLPPFTSPIVRCGYRGKEPIVALESGELWPVRPAYVPITAMTATNGVVVVGYDNGLVDRLDIALPAYAHRSRVTAVAASDSMTASGSLDGEIIVWQRSSELYRRRRDARVTHLALIPDADLLVSAHDDDSLAIWNDRGDSVAAIRFGDRITALVVDERTQLIYAASLDRTIRAIDYQGQLRGIIYGNHPFSAMALIRGNVMPGEVLAGDDAGALWTLRYRRPPRNVA